MTQPTATTAPHEWHTAVPAVKWDATPLRRSLNELARALAVAEGWDITPGVDFCDSPNPRLREWWDLACIAHEHFRGDSPDPAELEPEEETMMPDDTIAANGGVKEDL